MPFLLTRKNIEELRVDARVLGACPYRTPSRNQGWHPDLWAEQRRIKQMAPGEAMLTSGAEFDAKCGIITVPPIWEGGSRKEDLRLAACYDNSLRLAHRRRCKSIAFPLLSGDCHGFPKDLALRTAVKTIQDFLEKFDMTVYLSVREPSVLQIFDEQVAHVIRYVEEETAREEEANLRMSPENGLFSDGMPELDRCAPMAAEAMPCAPRAVPRKLEHLMEQTQETFSQKLLRLIDQKGLKDPQVYKKANLDRRLFSKIRGNANYQPSKITALALAIGLELNLDETKDLIGSAGFALTRSSKTDIILEYFIREGIYDIYEINQVLFAFEQPLIGE